MFLENPPIPSLLLFELLFNLFQVFGTIDFDNPAHLTCIAHQLLRPSVQHLDFAVARYGQVVQHDIGHGETTRVESKGITEEHESWCMVGQLVGKALDI